MNKKIVKIIILVVIILLSILITTYVVRKIDEKEYNKRLEDSLCEVLNPGIISINPIEYEVSDVSIPIFGIYDDNIDLDDWKSINKYKIEAVVTDGMCDSQNTYIGVKVKELFEKLGYKYNSAIFKTEGGLQVLYNNDEITDEVFLVFNINGNSLNGTVDLVSTEYIDKYSISNVLRIDFE